MKIVCFSGGHSSAIAAIEAVKKYGKENVMLLNHNISSKVEHQDIKRFKEDISNYLDIEITYANIEDWENKTPCQVCKDSGAFKVGNGTALCTNRLKTEPFKRWIKDNKSLDMQFIYGFDKHETSRIQRRIGVMAVMGYKTEYPLLWNRTIENTEAVGIPRPSTYKLFRHANCIGCLKAGKQQWYVTYCLRQDIWEEAKQAEKEIGYSILKDTYLEDLENEFFEMKHKKFICPDEKTPPATFWAKVRKTLPNQTSIIPCECAT